MVKKKNVGDTVMTSFAVTCLVTILFAVVTYSMSFTGGTAYIGGLSRAFLQGIVSDIGKGGIGNPNPLAATIPETVYMCFQMTFAIITPALIAGAFAERMKFSAMLWFIGLWAVLVYAPVAHWVWGPDGMLAAGNSDAMVKVLDYAGGTVVHINARLAGLMCAIWSSASALEIAPGHNMVLTMIGASLLWVGWFGFNAGSAVTAGVQAVYGDDRHPDRDCRRGLRLDAGRVDAPRQGNRHRHLLGRRCGPCGDHSGVRLRRPGWLHVASASPLAMAVLLLGRHRPQATHGHGIDDSLDCFGVHAVGGIVGALLTGVFAVEQYGGTAGLLEGNAGQLINQAEGILIVLVYDAIVSLIILKVLDAIIGLRVSKDVEREGLDLALHGETIQ